MTDLVISVPRRLYWAVQRELWESRSIYLAPLFVAAFFVFGFLISAFAHPELTQGGEKPFDFAAFAVMGATFIVSVFYCLDALYGERRDRSILFWKSLPVSDLTTVLSKATIPLVVLPLLTVVITIVTQAIMLLIGSAALIGSGRSAAALWNVRWFSMSSGLLYHMFAVHSLYYAPIFGWLLMVSAWAKRATFLWAALPLFAIGVVEKIAFNTSHFGAMLANRMSGGAQGAVYTANGGMSMPMTQESPLQFLVSPGLWIGLAIAAAFLGIAVWLRRNREPI